jgi:mono/diheme cytochrome c family protein
MMRFAGLLIFILSLSACFEVKNSSSQDAGFASDESLSPEFQAARSVFSQSCAGCHDFNILSEAELLARAEYVPGDPASSPIYNRLQNSDGANSDKDMPLGGSISADDVAAVKTWIESTP